MSVQNGGLNSLPALTGDEGVVRLRCKVRLAAQCESFAAFGCHADTC
jgi:hypothetical protein